MPNKCAPHVVRLIISVSNYKLPVLSKFEITGCSKLLKRETTSCSKLYCTVYVAYPGALFPGTLVEANDRSNQHKKVHICTDLHSV